MVFDEVVPAGALNTLIDLCYYLLREPTSGSNRYRALIVNDIREHTAPIRVNPRFDSAATIRHMAEQLLHIEEGLKKTKIPQESSHFLWLDLAELTVLRARIDILRLDTEYERREPHNSSVRVHSTKHQELHPEIHDAPYTPNVHELDAEVRALTDSLELECNIKDSGFIRKPISWISRGLRNH